MQVTAIATMLVNILSPYFSKASEEVAGELGQAAWSKATEVYQHLKARFQKEESNYPLETLERFQEKPDTRKAAMQEVLEEILSKDQSFSNSILELLSNVQQSSIGSTFNTNIVGGKVDEIINIDHLEGGININK